MKIINKIKRVERKFLGKTRKGMEGKKIFKKTLNFNLIYKK